ncbi:hypothetical protein SODG_006813 [Sodalis praecaptivus]
MILNLTVVSARENDTSTTLMISQCAATSWENL